MHNALAFMDTLLPFMEPGEALLRHSRSTSFQLEGLVLLRVWRNMVYVFA